MNTYRWKDAHAKRGGYNVLVADLREVAAPYRVRDGYVAKVQPRIKGWAADLDGVHDSFERAAEVGKQHIDRSIDNALGVIALRYSIPKERIEQFIATYVEETEEMKTWERVARDLYAVVEAMEQRCSERIREDRDSSDADTPLFIELRTTCRQALVENNINEPHE